MSAGFDQRRADLLLDQVHRRIGCGVDIETSSRTGLVDIRWRRSYDGVLSDERSAYGPSLAAALQAVLDHEDQADAEDAAAGSFSETETHDG